MVTPPVADCIFPLTSETVESDRVLLFLLNLEDSIIQLPWDA